MSFFYDEDHIIPQLLANAVSISVICLTLALFDWRLALTVFCTVPVAFLIIVFSRKISKSLSEKHVESKLKASDQVQEYLEGIKVIKSCRLAGAKFSMLDNAIRFMKDMAMKLGFVGGVFVTGSQIVVQAGIGLTVFIGTYLLTTGKIELIPLLMFFLIVVRIYGPILTEFTLLPELLYMQVSTSLRTLVSTPVMEGDAEKEIKDFNISFQNVSFNYTGKSTAYNNIKIGNIDATVEQLLAAAKAACCDEFVSSLPDGYQTLLGENGSTLSRGERQRISVCVLLYESI